MGPSLAERVGAVAAVEAGLRAVAVVLGAWLAATTAASTARRVVPALRRADGLDRFTLPIVRRLLDVLLTAVIGAGLPSPAAGAAARTTPAPITHVAVVAAHAPAPDVPVVRAPVAPAPVHVPPAPPLRPPVASRHIVVGGDNLWSIARAELQRRGHASVTDRDVARYWAQIIKANRAYLRSGNPSLIFPGETILLPA